MKILTRNHLITGNEYFRQKRFCPYDSDNYAVSTFFAKWTSIRYLVSDIWLKKALSDLDEEDKHYPYNPSFLKTYEFIEFDNKEEKKLVEITKDNEVKEINERSFGCYRLWKDWVKHFVSEMDEEEIERTIKTRINVCPRCGVGEIEEKVGKYGKFKACSNFPNCRYTVNILSDEYYDFNRKNEELFLIRQEISKRKIIK